MANDNNLLLIILIGIVLFWIFNINTTEKNYKATYVKFAIKNLYFFEILQQ